ncbi:MAG: 30S ribosomal protein S3 [Firmicutes bacterium]|jgi:small subunit ribosomal protein S3|nr:30S ribosomal protein S3 [Bacillota bacterium]MBQ1431111.1 30S ribosomal protein S3 [Bacillota bacterium]MBQ1631105.1 30S ribosomal protein S3 [Bacillota bacterium]MBQ1690962.1 30S ribosomal protein S3 [Bacillota bacterium]MBQ1715756.1 30S ribosomal protein S3 [Bacillota bacterium]
MGQKVSPHGFRVGVIKDWDSKWYAGKKNFADNLIEDNKVRQYITKKLYAAGVAKVVIERASGNKLRANVMTAKPGMVIGRSGDGIDAIKKDLAKLTGKEVEIEIIEIRRPELDAQLSAEAVAQSLERRTSFRRAMKQQISRTMKAGAKGIKVVVSGRLGGAEIARSEKYSEGNVPLHTLRADIDYGFAEADTTYGRIGVKVWINHGEVLDKGLKSAIPEEKREKKGDKRQRREGGRRDGSRQDRREGRRNDRFQKEEAPKATPRIRRTPKPAPVEAPQEVEAQEPMETTEA